MKKRFIITACFSVLSVVFPLMSYAAGTATGNIAVSADANSICSVMSGTMNFGLHDYTGVGNTDAQGTLLINCSAGAAYSIALSAGTGGTFAARVMQPVSGNLSTYNLSYQLYTNSPRDEIWGDGTNTTGVVSGTAPSNSNIPVAIYGRIPGGQINPTGSYSDVIIVSISYA